MRHCQPVPVLPGPGAAGARAGVWRPSRSHAGLGLGSRAVRCLARWPPRQLLALQGPRLAPHPGHGHISQQTEPALMNTALGPTRAILVRDSEACSPGCIWRHTTPVTNFP